MRPFGSMLRNTRGNLAQQGITAAQLAFQLVVTVVGVYIAIYLQDASDQRARARAADRTLSAIAAELVADELTLDSIIDGQRRQSAAMLAMAAAIRSPNVGDTAVHPILVVEQFSNRTFYPRAGAYDALLSTGQLEHIDDGRLRLLLAQIYEHDYDRLRRNGELSDLVWLEVLRRAQLDYWDFEMRRPVSDPAAAMRMSNAAHRVESFAGNYIRVMEATRDRVRAARRAIDGYLTER